PVWKTVFIIPTSRNSESDYIFVTYDTVNGSILCLRIHRTLLTLEWSIEKWNYEKKRASRFNSSNIF
ncbi:MAG: hypothetical protein ACI9FN_002600, partial [Saprospiraceae bacterium]